MYTIYANIYTAIKDAKIILLAEQLQCRFRYEFMFYNITQIIFIVATYLLTLPRGDLDINLDQMQVLTTQP